MPLTIPLGSIDLSPAKQLRNRISRSENERRMLRAVIGGVAIADPAEAVQKKTKKKGELISANIKDAELEKLFDAVEVVIDDPGSGPTVSALDQLVARKLGTSAANVAAVRKVAENDKPAREAGLAWAATLDVDLLAQAGDKANTEVQLKRIPTVEKKQNDLEQRVDDLRDDLTKLTAEVAELKSKSAASSSAKR